MDFATCVRLSLAGLGFATWLVAQGLITTASRNDWEEINFVFNSSTLSDGYPSLLRLADLLAQNPGYSARLYGYTDSIGPDQVNEALSRARAEAVKAFLVKNGARPTQIQTSGRGKRDPEASNASREGRFMNRRVRIAVTDERGKEVGAAPLGVRVRPIRDLQPRQPATSKVYQQASAGPGSNNSQSCFAVQVGAFRERANAQRQRERVQRESQSARLEPRDANPPLWRVLAGCEPTREAVQALAERLELELGSVFVVRTHPPSPGS